MEKEEEEEPQGPSPFLPLQIVPEVQDPMSVELVEPERPSQGQEENTQQRGDVITELAPKKLDMDHVVTRREEDMTAMVQCQQGYHGERAKEGVIGQYHEWVTKVLQEANDPLTLAKQATTTLFKGAFTVSVPDQGPREKSRIEWLGAKYLATRLGLDDRHVREMVDDLTIEGTRIWKFRLFAHSDRTAWYISQYLRWERGLDANPDVEVGPGAIREVAESMCRTLRSNKWEAMVHNRTAVKVWIGRHGSDRKAVTFSNLQDSRLHDLLKRTAPTDEAFTGRRKGRTPLKRQTGAAQNRGQQTGLQLPLRLGHKEEGDSGGRVYTRTNEDTRLQSLQVARPDNRGGGDGPPTTDVTISQTVVDVVPNVLNQIPHSGPGTEGESGTYRTARPQGN